MTEKDLSQLKVQRLRNKNKNTHLKMSGFPLQSPQLHQLMQYFSSYLSDTTALISAIKNHVYELIQIDLPTAKGGPVAPDIYDIMAGCKKTYQDLRRTQSILRSHLKAKKTARVRTISQPSLSKVQQCQVLEPLSSSCITSSYTHLSKEITIDTPLVQSSQFKAAPYKTGDSKRTKTCQNQQKPVPDQSQNNSPNKDSTTPRQNPERGDQAHCLSRTRSLQFIKKLQEIKQSRASTMQTFQQNNLDCLTIIKRIKEEVKVMSLKKKKYVKPQH